jgi:hypothetical protein
MFSARCHGAQWCFIRTCHVRLGPYASVAIYVLLLILGWDNRPRDDAKFLGEWSRLYFQLLICIYISINGGAEIWGYIRKMWHVKDLYLTTFSAQNKRKINIWLIVLILLLFSDWKRREANWICHIFYTNCLLKDVIEGRIEGKKRRGRRRKSGYWLILRKMEIFKKHSIALCAELDSKEVMDVS